jgi:biopolymer transport protein ExbB
MFDIQMKVSALASHGTQWILWLLLALSLVGGAIVVERAAFLLFSRDDVSLLRAEMRRLLARGDRERARHRLEESTSFEAKVALAALSADTMNGAEQRMAGEGQLARIQMERNLAFLGTVASNAPFVGLLGTVIGIVRAFHELGGSGAHVSAGLMTEIGEALVATAIGLLVALPAVAFFNLFQRIIRIRIARADALGREVLAYFDPRGDERGARSGTGAMEA